MLVLANRLLALLVLLTLISGCESAPVDTQDVATDAYAAVASDELDDARTVGLIKGIPTGSAFKNIPDDSPFLLRPPDPRLLAAHSEWGRKTGPILAAAYGLLASDSSASTKAIGIRNVLRHVDRFEDPYWRWRSTSSLAMRITEDLMQHPEGVEPETFAFYARLMAEVGNPNTDLISQAIAHAGSELPPAERVQVARDALGAYDVVQQARARLEAQQGSRPVAPKRAAIHRMMTHEPPAIRSGANRLRQIAQSLE